MSLASESLVKAALEYRDKSLELVHEQAARIAELEVTLNCTNKLYESRGEYIAELEAENRQLEEDRLLDMDQGYYRKLEDRIAELKALITEVIPLIGYEASVPELKNRAEDAVDYGAERETP